jgi:hypothetical protein
VPWGSIPNRRISAWHAEHNNSGFGSGAAMQSNLRRAVANSESKRQLNYHGPPAQAACSSIRRFILFVRLLLLLLLLLDRDRLLSCRRRGRRLIDEIRLAVPVGLVCEAVPRASHVQQGYPCCQVGRSLSYTKAFRGMVPVVF